METMTFMVMSSQEQHDLSSLAPMRVSSPSVQDIVEVPDVGLLEEFSAFEGVRGVENVVEIERYDFCSGHDPCGGTGNDGGRIRCIINGIIPNLMVFIATVS